MNTFWTVRRASSAVGAHMPDDRPISGVSTDTRTLAPGNLFVALRGERFDGHDFIVAALERGAGALLVDDGSRAGGAGVPVFVVPDTLVALGALAHTMRVAWSRAVIAIGGSNGKTTTKDLTRAALGAVYEVHATQGNLNNRIGVPLTLLDLGEASDLAVVEVGTNQPGEVAMLRDIVRPDVAVVTNVQEEHLEGFGDLAGVMAEELSLCDGVELAIVPAGDEALVAEAGQRARSVLAVGTESGDFRPDAWGMGADGHGWIEFDGERVRLPAAGAHNVVNSLLAVAVARSCGVDARAAAAALPSARLAPMRSSVEPLGDSLLLNDAYNANPGSMRAALSLIQSVAGTRPIALVLGSMRELGPRAAEYHDEIARLAVASPARVIGAVGDFASAFGRVAAGDDRVVSAEDPASLWLLLEPRLPEGCAILLKGSRGVRLEQLVPMLRGWAGVPSDEGNQSH